MRIKLLDIAEKAGVSVSTVSRALNNPDEVKVSTLKKVFSVINEMGYKPKLNVAKTYVKYKDYMAKKPNDTVLKRWGMYTHDERYRDYTASIVKMIKDDMKINDDQAYYMLYYMVSNNIDDYERAKRDMMVDEKFEIYRRKRRS